MAMNLRKYGFDIPKVIGVIDARKHDQIEVTEWQDPVNDRVLYRLQLQDMHIHVALDRNALPPYTKDKRAVEAHIKYSLQKGAMQLQDRYYARWSSHDADELGVTWGLCHKCGQASMWQPVINTGNPVWECRRECPR